MDNNLHIKKILRSEEALPEHLAWEEMEAGIINAMDQKEEDKKLPFLWIFGFVALLMIGGYFLFQNNTQKTNISEAQVDIKKANILNANESESINIASNDDKTQSINETTNIEESSNQTATKQKKQVQQTITNYNSSQKPNLNSSSLNSSSSSSSSSSNYSGGNGFKTTLSSQEHYSGNQSNTGIISSQKKSPLYQGNQTDFSDIKMIEHLNHLPTIIAKLDFNSSKPILVEAPESKEQTVLKEKHLKRYSLNFLASANQMSPNFSGSTLATEKNNSESSEIGYGSALLFNYQFDKNWELSTGLKYQKLFTKFQYYHTSPGIVSVNTYHGLRDLGVTNWRNITHYNSYETWSIPVTINRLWNSTSRLSFKTGLGLQYNLVGKTNGKTLGPNLENPLLFDIYEGEIVLYQLNNKLNFISNVGINFMVNQRFSLGLNLSYQSALSNMSRDASFDFHSTIWSSGISLGYRL